MYFCRHLEWDSCGWMDPNPTTCVYKSTQQLCRNIFSKENYQNKKQHGNIFPNIYIYIYIEPNLSETSKWDFSRKKHQSVRGKYRTMTHQMPVKWCTHHIDLSGHACFYRDCVCTYPIQSDEVLDFFLGVCRPLRLQFSYQYLNIKDLQIHNKILMLKQNQAFIWLKY